MKRIIALLSVAAVAVALLAGCSSVSGSSDLDKPFDLTNSANLTTLCGTEAQSVSDFVASAANAQPASQHRKELTKWGIKDPTDDKSLATLQTALTQRAKVTCVSDTIGNVSLSPELKALLDASRAPTDQCLEIVKSHGGDAAIVNGVYTLTVMPAMVGKIVNGKELVVKEDGDPTHLQWSDALSLILQGSTPEEMRGNVELAICTEPLIGVSLAHLFAHNGVLELQTTNWLDPYNVDANQINDLVSKFVPLLNVSGTPTNAQYEEAAKASIRYEKMASKLVYLLSHYELASVMPLNSTHTYHLVNGGLTADGVPEVGIDTGLDNRPALVFYLTEKTACKPISVLGFNVGDKRPELGNIPQDCTTLTPPAPPAPPVPPTSTCASDCGSTPAVCPYNPSLPPNSPECLEAKIPSQGVAENPNVDPFLKDGGDKHVVSNGDGSKVANGDQGSAADVAAAQKAAAAKAAADAAAAAAAQAAAEQAAQQSGGGTVDTDQNKGDSGGQPNW